LSSEAHKQADGHFKVLPVPTVAKSKPAAMSCELTCLHSSSLIVQKLSWKKIIYNKNTTAGIGNGFEQAQVHQLRAYMLTMKLMVISKFM
jgi:hypothetical protein